MKIFISGGYLNNEGEGEGEGEELPNNDDSTQSEIDKGLDISNFYKNSTSNLNTKLPNNLLKRLQMKQEQVTTPATTTATTTTESYPTFYCNICENNIINTSLEQHESSITHIVITKRKDKFVPKRYVSSSLPNSNVGFKILSSESPSIGVWSNGDSLGANNQGTINPIKVEKKLNNYGIGKVDYKNSNSIFKNNRNNKDNNNNTLKKSMIKYNNKLKKEKESKIRELLS